jgi:hypothetical protein
MREEALRNSRPLERGDWTLQQREASFISKGNDFVFSVDVLHPNAPELNVSYISVWRKGIFCTNNGSAVLYMDNGKWSGGPELMPLYALSNPMFESLKIAKKGCADAFNSDTIPLPWIREAVENEPIGQQLLKILAGSGQGRIIKSDNSSSHYSSKTKWRMEVEAHEKPFYMPHTIRYFQDDEFKGETKVEEYKQVALPGTEFTLGLPRRTTFKYYFPDDGSLSFEMACEVIELEINGSVDDSEFDVFDPIMFKLIEDRNTGTLIPTKK